MAHSVVELKTKAIKKVETPKGSWLDSNGKRWIKVLFDVMIDNGSRFLRQVQVTLGLHFDFGIGGYVIDLEIGAPLAAEIIRQHPSLGGVRNPNFIPTNNRLLR